MVADRKTLTPEQLHEILTALDRVMADAERLRGSITEQLSAHRHHDQQTLSPASNRPVPPPRPRGRRRRDQA